MSPTQRSTLFDRWSATYDEAVLQRSTYRPIHDAVLTRLETTSPSSILDLGCGTGRLTERLGGRFPDAEVVGVDYSPGMLDEASRRVRSPGRRLVLADAQQLPFAPASFDLATCTESFHWYPDQRSALGEIARVLTPGGRLIIVSVATLTRIGDEVIGRMSTIAGRRVRAVPPGRMAELLRAAGFEVREQRRIRRGLVPWPALTDARLAEGTADPDAD